MSATVRPAFQTGYSDPHRPAAGDLSYISCILVVTASQFKLN